MTETIYNMYFNGLKKHGYNNAKVRQFHIGNK